MDISNIDDMLMGTRASSQEETPQESYESTDEADQEVLDDSTEELESSSDESQDDHKEEPEESKEEEDIPQGDHKKEYDEYGNEKEVLSKSMQKRLERQAESMRRKHEAEIAELRSQIDQLTPQQQQQVQKAVQNFEADPSDDSTWQQQLDSYIEHTVKNMHEKSQRQAQEARERDIQREFEAKLVNGMERFNDFRETIQGLPCQISDHMTIATRSLEDPAAFLYAAAKRHPEELSRISKLPDPYAQIREMGKLEERMRKQKTPTKAPRPLGRTQDDATIPEPKSKKEETIEELIAKSEAKRLAQLRVRQHPRTR